MSQWVQRQCSAARKDMSKDIAGAVALAATRRLTPTSIISVRRAHHAAHMITQEVQRPRGYESSIYVSDDTASVLQFSWNHRWCTQLVNLSSCCSTHLSHDAVVDTVEHTWHTDKHSWLAGTDVVHQLGHVTLVGANRMHEDTHGYMLGTACGMNHMRLCVLSCVCVCVCVGQGV